MVDEYAASGARCKGMRGVALLIVPISFVLAGTAAALPPYAAGDVEHHVARACYLSVGR